ncbi:MAG: hypothetical protein LAO04_07430 [Acidobacteriia bacterium]|nr:hypothetical protein [Terriglobia bacterium]
MRKELEEKLAKRFPKWFNVNGDVRHTLMPFGFQCGDGWFGILWRLCVDLEPLVAELEKETGERFEVVQAKQKLGTVVGQRARTDASSMWLFARAKGATAGSFRVGDHSLRKPHSVYASSIRPRSAGLKLWMKAMNN